MREPLHHLHQRKRKNLASKIKQLEKYPSDKKFIAGLDKVVLAMSVIGPAFNVPQIYSIFALQSALGVSLISWLAYTLMNIPWILYGYVHKEKPIIISSSLWFITNLIIVSGILIYS